MEALDTIKAKGQKSFTNLLAKAQSQPDEVKTWGVTAGSAVVGALAIAGAANGILALASTLAAPPVALTIGAVGGGFFAWNYMQGRQTTPQPEMASDLSMSAEATPVVTALVDEPVGALPVAELPVAELDAVALPPTDVAEISVVATTIPVEATPEPTAETTEALASPATNDLEVIHGIGPVYASRFQAAGIQTIAQLAQLTPERVHEIIGPIRSGQMIDAEGWITEATQLVESESRSS